MAKSVRASVTDVFLTHDWGEDDMGRQNHQRVAKISEELNRRGFLVWFDEVMMEGEVIEKMVEGINGTRSVIVFITRRYMQKVNGLGGKKDDNCKMEYEYSLRTKTTANMVCVVMEKNMANPSAWKDKLLFTMGGSIFVSMDGDLDNKIYMTKKMDELEKQLRMKGITPSQVLKHCLKCDILGDGKFCHYCGHGLLEVAGKAKNYCTHCNTHSNGIFCSHCGKGLPEIEESKQIGIMVKLAEFEKLKKESEANNQEEFKISGNELTQLKEENMKLKEAETVFKEQIEALQTDKKKNELKKESEANNQEEFKTLGNELKQLKEENITLKEAETGFKEQIETSQTDKKKNEEEFKTLGNELKQLKEENITLKEAETVFKEQIEASQTDKKKNEEENLKLKEAETAFNEKIEALQSENEKLREENNTSKEVGTLKEEIKKAKERVARSDNEKKKIIAEYDSSSAKYTYVEGLIKKGDVKTVRTLIEDRKEILKLRDGGEHTPYLDAARYGSVEMLQMMYDMGADVNAVNGNKRTALHLAALYNTSEVVKWMCEKTHQLINAKNTWDETPLHKASYSSSSSLLHSVRYLLDHGGDVSMKDNSGYTPLGRARYYNKTEIEAVLVNWMKEQGLEIK